METLLHSITHHTTTTAPHLVHNWSGQLEPKKLIVPKAVYNQMTELSTIRPLKSNLASPLHLESKYYGVLARFRLL